MTGHDSKSLNSPQTPRLPSSPRDQRVRNEGEEEAQEAFEEVSSVAKDPSGPARGNAPISESPRHNIESLHANEPFQQNGAESPIAGPGNEEMRSGRGNASDSPADQRVMVYRVIYFVFFVSLIAPFINFAFGFRLPRRSGVNCCLSFSRSCLGLCGAFVWPQ